MKTINMTKEGGRVSTDVDLGYLFSTLRNGKYILTIKRAAEKRSVSQNDLLWLWMTCIEQETGTPKEDCYLYYCKRFLSKQIRIGAQHELVYETSSKLSTVQMSDFLDKIQADALQELGINLPDPQDKYFENFYEEFN